MRNAEIITIGGTRPELIKLSKFVKLLRHHDHAFVYTGQHYSTNMREVFLDQLGIKPDHDLGCATSDTIAIKSELTKLFQEVRPRFVVVYGDTSSSLAGALAAKEQEINLIHVEAGLRCFDPTVPEELIRMQIDSMSNYFLAPTDLSKSFLAYEGKNENVFVTGNLVADVCKDLSGISNYNSHVELPEKYVLLTLHRQENVEDPEKLAQIRKHLETLDFSVVFPIHPRTRNNLLRYRINLPSNVHVIEPVGYLEFLSLLKNCQLVLTDSGGIQEEAVVLRKPCITLRNTTERWETILQKANVLFPLWRQDSLNEIAHSMIGRIITTDPYGENVAEKSVQVINHILSQYTKESFA